MKYLLVLIVLIIAYNVWRKQRIDDKRSGDQQRPAPPRTPRIPQEIVPCARCGLMLPRSEALQQGELHFCSVEHQRQGPA
ncbi:PP0621 family protein [Diaphorobacter aerolatus]|uniref:Preprotein translocase subunit YajC n=1 Tax=Diaphorobacter aerolatus TaxID=1288495 RepID=A0A7H0GHJ7_9BURK|nr:PP0621 family protein [Diaphorobacter aerolatus]QNP47763.1 hypothetical protein H9K75_16520 [Diaphorobacter aerolatus]